MAARAVDLENVLRGAEARLVVAARRERGVERCQKMRNGVRITLLSWKTLTSLMVVIFSLRG